MLSIEGQFTFTAEQPQLHCATFFIGEPEELITIDYDFVDIDCQGGDFLKVRNWQLLLLVPVPALVCEMLAVCGRACECVCVCAHIQMLLQSIHLWDCCLSSPRCFGGTPTTTTPIKQSPSQAGNQSPNCSMVSSELFQEHLH